MLEKTDGYAPNLLTPEAVRAATQTVDRLKRQGGPGLIQQDRLRRNLLSSQPLCFNLFGHLSDNRSALLPWIQSIDATASAVNRVQLEIAPTSDPIGGSAFDAFVEYSARGRRRFLGVECKYAESLVTPAPKQVNKYLAATRPPNWTADAASRLNTSTLRQFWFNTLLVHQTLSHPSEGPYDQGSSVVVAMAQDGPARHACDAVSDQLAGAASVHFSSLQTIVDLVAGEEEWKRAFRERYLDLHESTGEA